MNINLIVKKFLFILFVATHTTSVYAGREDPSEEAGTSGASPRSIGEPEPARRPTFFGLMQSLSKMPVMPGMFGTNGQFNLACLAGGPEQSLEGQPPHDPQPVYRMTLEDYAAVSNTAEPLRDYQPSGSRLGDLLLNPLTRRFETINISVMWPSWKDTENSWLTVSNHRTLMTLCALLSGNLKSLNFKIGVPAEEADLESYFRQRKGKWMTTNRTSLPSEGSSQGKAEAVGTIASFFGGAEVFELRNVYIQFKYHPDGTFDLSLGYSGDTISPPAQESGFQS